MYLEAIKADHYSYIASIMHSLILSFLRFIALFLGTGFIAGSIVHLGEGVNVWDVSILSLGVLLFVTGSFAQERASGSVNIRKHGIVQFFILSFFLSVGIGMASGGMQHFVDTPSYSAVLIPLGFTLGFLAYLFKEGDALERRQWWTVACGSLVLFACLALILRYSMYYLPEPQSHHATSVVDVPTIEKQEEDGHGH